MRKTMAAPSRARSRVWIRVVSLVVLAVAGAGLGAAGCGPPPGFDPNNGCQPLTKDGCEVCASRGGCGWCANGCVPAEGASCASGLVTEPGSCPGATP
ncbi:MAG: hypothetical protein R3B70_19345 [Polyangiaceae bacterium]